MHYVLGHVKWFVEDPVSLYTPSLSTSEWLVVVLSLIIGVGLLFLVDKLLRKPDKALDNKFKPLKVWVPTVVRWSTAGLLIFNYWQGNFYAPNIKYGASILSSLLIASLIAVAILLLLGAYTRIAGAILFITFLGGVFVINDPIQMLDHLAWIGIGLYLMFAETGKLSVNKKLADPLSPVLEKFEYLAQPLLKIFIGLGLVIIAFSEKLLNMSLANIFLIDHSSWNIISSFGLNNRNFIILASIVQILIGLSLILNKATRLSTLVLIITMLITSALLGPKEVTGHLFAVGLVFAVWVGPNKSLNLRKKHS